MPTYEAWEDDDGAMVATAATCADHRARGPLVASARLLFAFEAATDEEAMAIFNLRMGWQPYRSIGEPGPCPACGATIYPQGSRQCWRCAPDETA